MVLIYKITNPAGNIYVGQTIDYKARLKNYKTGLAKNQPKLHNSFLKYGFENHIFEILEFCKKEQLNKKERYWQLKYNTISRYGLNCKLTNENDSNGTFTEETKLKMSIAKKGKKLSEETKRKMSEQRKGEKNAMYGRKQSDETKNKIRDSKKNLSKETIEKFRKNAKNRTKEHQDKIRKALLGLKPVNSKIVLNTETGIFYMSITDASKTLSKGAGSKTLVDKLSGKRKNNTNFILV